MAHRETELEQQVTTGWAYLADHGEESADPAAPNQLAWARGSIAWALLELDRLTESEAVADGLIAYCETAGDAAGNDWLLYGLSLKRSSLLRQHRRSEAAALDAEIIMRFRDDVDPEVRRYVVTAMGNRCRFLLDDPEQAARGVEVSDELLALLTEEPDDSVLAIAEELVSHLSALMNGEAGIEGHLAVAAQAVLANASALAGLILGHAPPAVRARLPGHGVAERIDMTLVPEPIKRIRRRLTQATRLGDALLVRLRTSEDPETGPLLARAELFTAVCLGMQGHFSETSRRMDEMEERHDPDVAAAYAYVADHLDDPRSWFARLGAVATLAQRARALVGDDPALARIAYEDSVAAKVPGADRWPLRWVIAWLTPGA